MNFLRSPVTPLRPLFIHVLCWMLYIAEELTFLRYYTGQLEPAINYACFYAINLSLFYALVSYFDLVIHRFSFQWLRLLLGFLVIFSIYLLLKLIIDRLIYPGRVATGTLLSGTRGLIINAARGFQFSVLATFYSVASYLHYYRRKALEYRIASLQQQMNPHLLFNVLHQIYSTVYPLSEEAAHSIYLLSEIQRYSVRIAEGAGLVPLTEELHQVQTLIDLQQSRYQFPLRLQFTVEGTTTGFQLIPHSLLTLAENLFKHGNLLTPARPAELHITCTPEGLLHYSCQNEKARREPRERSSGVGLQNLRLRLAYAYPGKHRLDITETAHTYNLQLTLQL